MTASPVPASGERRVEGLSEAIYGLILSTSVVAALSEDPGVSARSLFAAVAVTALVFWLAHVYARAMASRMVDPRRFTWRGIRGVMGWQAPLMAGALPALVLLGAAWVGLMSVDTAVDLAIGAGVAGLAGCGLVIALQRGLSVPATVMATLLSGALGFVILGLKLAIH